MVDTAGNKLRRARQTRHLTLEDAARATKIRVSQLADLEADEYSNFANLAYARSFLANYSRFLRVDLRKYLEGFSDGGSFGLEDYQYLSAKPVGVYRIPYRRGASRKRRPQRRQLIGLAAGLAAMLMGAFGWVLYVNVQRLGDLDKLAARQEARERAGHDGAAAAVTTMVSAPASNPAMSPAPSPNGEPVNVPSLLPAGGSPASSPALDPPAPTAAPAAAPAQTSIPTLATVGTPNISNPVLPIPGDGRTVRELLTAHAGQPQPQKVVNDHPRGQ